MKSINFRGFSGPNGCWAPPGKKSKPPSGQIPEYAPECECKPHTNFVKINQDGYDNIHLETIVQKRKNLSSLIIKQIEIKMLDFFNVKKYLKKDL